MERFNEVFAFVLSEEEEQKVATQQLLDSVVEFIIEVDEREL